MTDWTNGWTRRQFGGGLVAAGATSGILAAAGRRATAQQPAHGGRLRVGAQDISATETIDPAKSLNSIDYIRVNLLYSRLVNFVPGIGPSPVLATEWEPSADATRWVFRLREGVEFHNGKTLTAADVVHSLQRIQDPNTASPVAGLISDVASISADGDNTVVLDMSAPNADLPNLLTAYHFLIVPADASDFPADAIGTGPWMMKDFEPGRPSLFVRNPNYFREGLPYIDEIEVTGVPDDTARSNALLAGDLDVIAELDPRLVGQFEAAEGVKILSGASGSHVVYPMMCNEGLYADNNMRLAVKHALDRQRYVDIAFGGQGIVANDHPIAPFDPYHCSDIPQRGADPDKVAYHLRQAGHENTALTLETSDAVYGGVDSAVVMAELMSEAGLNISVSRNPADGYWSEVPGKKPWFGTYYFGRPSANAMLSLVYLSDSGWNEPQWKNERFDSIIHEARGVTDEALLKELYCEAQWLLHDEGPSLMPIFYNWLDGLSSRVQGMEAHPQGPLGQLKWDEVWLSDGEA